MVENEQTGISPLRALLVEFEGDPQVKKIKDQFMLGTDLMMAPIVELGIVARDLYMPKGNWTHFFTNQTYDFTNEGGWLNSQAAYLGTPLVFVKGSLKEALFSSDKEEKDI